jgi:indolepyruvate ferredoxin oxidoreductase
VVALLIGSGSGREPDDLLAARMTAVNGVVAMSGVQALLRAPLDQIRVDRAGGMRTAGLISGYQGSPLGGVPDAYAAHRGIFEASDVYLIPGVNEDLGATAVWGSQLAGMEASASYDGVVGLWFGKGPGLDRSGDAIRHANFSGVDPRGGVLLAVGDDPFCKSSSIPCGSEQTLADLAVPTLYPANAQEVLVFGRAAYEISRFCGSWVGLKMHADVADSYAAVDLAASFDVPTDLRRRIEWPDRDRPVQRYSMVSPASVEAEAEAYGIRLAAARTASGHLGLDRQTRSGNARLGIIAAGATYGQLRDALAAEGLADEAALETAGIRVLKPAMIWPLNRDLIAGFARGLEEIFVVEEKRAFMETQIRDLLYGTRNAPRVTGRTDPSGAALLPVGGGLRAQDIGPSLRARLAAALQLVPRHREQVTLELQPARTASLLPVRSAFTCSGCPHNVSTVLPEGSIGHGGIGCHGMVLKMDRGVVGITQMGGEGAQWVGTEHFVGDKHRFQNIGDGTLAHSGFLAIRQAVAAGTAITYKILYNATVAMTGGQDAPGGLPVPALVRQLEAEGVRRIVVVTDDPGKYRRRLRSDTRLPRAVDVFHRDRLDEVQRELRDIAGVTVLVYDQACAAELRRARKRGKLPQPARRIMIDEGICEGCGDCGRVSNCASVLPVLTVLGRKTRIDQDSCNYDATCLKGNCPAFVSVTVTEPSDRTAKPGSRRASQPGESHEPATEPGIPASANVVLAGIGGTGVTTLSRILVTAATLDGKSVIGLDQTGLAQKGGAVVSHLRVHAPEDPESAVGSSRVPEHGADLALIFDAVTGAQNTDLYSPDRTVVVASTRIVPTGAMVAGRSDDPVPDLGRLRVAVDAATRAADNVWLDSGSLAAAEFGSPEMSNLILLGVAYQRGLVPVTAGSIEKAITANGARVQANIDAFRLGRRRVGDPAGSEVAGDHDPGRSAPVQRAQGIAAALAGLTGPQEFLDKIGYFAAELADSRNVSYAAQFAGFVRQVREAECRVDPGLTTLSETVALQLFRLMAYKDEYEVARLALRSDLRREVAARHGRARIAYELFPPTLRLFGLRKKLAVPARIAIPMFRILYAGRRLRGTRADPFGYSADRRMERELIGEYQTLIADLLHQVTAASYDDAVGVAALAEMIRGYDTVKRANVLRYREAVSRQHLRFRESAAAVISVQS